MFFVLLYLKKKKISMIGKEWVRREIIRDGVRKGVRE